MLSRSCKERLERMQMSDRMDYRKKFFQCQNNAVQTRLVLIVETENSFPSQLFQAGKDRFR